MEERRVADGQRRQIDKLLEALIDEVKGFREDMAIMRGQIAPLNELSKQVYAAKMAVIWGFGFMAVVGSIVAWWLNVRHGIKELIGKM
jgi:hypothetical protein